VSQTVETETAAVVVPFAANVRFAESDEPVWEETAEMAVSVARSALASWARPERLRCARVVDDSMAPAIRDGDLVVLDAGRAEPLDGQMFVVRTGEGVLVKRLRRTDDRWELESDNPAYEPRAVTGRDRILGQVAWAGPPSAGHKTQSASGAASGGRST
jgi:phage repressor protein C with HTH and peptisase S24 domain